MIKNLPEVPPQLPDSATTQNGFDENGEILRNNALILSEQTPSGADVVFDCIRVSPGLLLSYNELHGEHVSEMFDLMP